MTTVYQAFGLRKPEDNDIGLEIEVEGRHLPRAVPGWHRENDGSLRAEETAEYVLSKPATLADVGKHLGALHRAYERDGTVVDDSVRAGIHVHINCQKLTMTQMFNFVTTFFILENLLVHWCGPTREGNLFCLRSADADWMLRVIRIAIRTGIHAMRRVLYQDNMRYSSINLKALGDYGSLEFRTMRGTRDLDSVYKWAETLYNLREFSKHFDNPEEVIRQFSIVGPEAFLAEALGENTGMFTKGVHNYREMLMAGVRNAQDIAFCTDWSKFEQKQKVYGGAAFPFDMAEFNIVAPMEDM